MPVGTRPGALPLLLASLALVRASEGVARIGQCTTAPDNADFDSIWQWERRVERTATK